MTCASGDAKGDAVAAGRAAAAGGNAMAAGGGALAGLDVSIVPCPELNHAARMTSPTTTPPNQPPTRLRSTNM